MYVHSVKLINYKSFGDYAENEIILEPRVTAIIGKNESGKSNVLDGLRRIGFTTRYSDAFGDEIVNRNCPSGNENRYLIILKPTDDEALKGISGDTVVEIHKNGYILQGSFLSYYLKEIYPDIKTLLEVLGPINANPFQLRDQDLTNYRAYYNELQTEAEMNVPLKTAAMDFLNNRIGKIGTEKKELLHQSLETAQRKWQELIRILPVFFYRNRDKRLNASYRYEDIEKELKNPNSVPYSLLSDFVHAIDVSNDDFLLASRSGTSSNQESMRRRINRIVNEKINANFNKFYQAENIYLDLSFNSGKVSFAVQSNDGEALMLSERSDGLRWYLETFIDAQAYNFPERNVVYLLDEPGTSLHVNAQRELLNLFGHLAEQGNQIVYTTHSPYLLNTQMDGVHRIRAVVKDTGGYSRIYKTAYDSRIAPESQQDTLAPIISALGMNLQDTFGPAKDKINIVTEGMSDYIYLCTMAKIIGIDANKYSIIPSVGAPNCINICAILHGWGCQYIALFDYDKAGVETGGEYMRKKMFLEYKKHYCYVKDVSEDEITSQSYKTSKYMIEDVMIRTEIERFCVENNCINIDKTLTAKLMCNAIEEGSFLLSENSKKQFGELFRRIFSCFS